MAPKKPLLGGQTLGKMELKRILALSKRDERPRAIAKAVGRSQRFVGEVLLVFTKNAPTVQEAVMLPRNQGGIVLRLACRVAQLPPKAQKALLPKLRGLDQAAGLRILRREEQKCQAVKRGRKSKFALASKPGELCAQMAELVKRRLETSPKDKEALAAKRVLEVLSGKLSPARVLPPGSRERRR